jgi:hypothetical protein
MHCQCRPSSRTHPQLAAGGPEVEAYRVCSAVGAHRLALDRPPRLAGRQAGVATLPALAAVACRIHRRPAVRTGARPDGSAVHREDPGGVCVARVYARSESRRRRPLRAGSCRCSAIARTVGRGGRRRNGSADRGDPACSGTGGRNAGRGKSGSARSKPPTTSSWSSRGLETLAAIDYSRARHHRTSPGRGDRRCAGSTMIECSFGPSGVPSCTLPIHCRYCGSSLMHENGAQLMPPSS